MTITRHRTWQFWTIRTTIIALSYITTSLLNNYPADINQVIDSYNYAMPSLTSSLLFVMIASIQPSEHNEQRNRTKVSRSQPAISLKCGIDVREAFSWLQLFVRGLLSASQTGYVIFMYDSLLLLPVLPFPDSGWAQRSWHARGRMLAHFAWKLARVHPSCFVSSRERIWACARCRKSLLTLPSRGHVLRKRAGINLPLFRFVPPRRIAPVELRARSRLGHFELQLW